VAEDGAVTRITSPTLFGFTLRSCSAETLAHARHQADVIDAGFWELTLDAAQRGVGGDDSWGANVLAPYRISPGAGNAVFAFSKKV